MGGPTLIKLAVATAQSGIIFEYGALSPEPTPLPLFDVLGRSLSVRGYMLMEITGDPQRLEAAKRFMVGGLASGNLKPTIARTFALDGSVVVHRFLENNQQIGKIVMTV